MCSSRITSATAKELSRSVDGYSARSAARGSILVARRGGSHAAINPTAISSSAHPNE
jgi:hypothetical protein